jgi:rhodanese-related sulfurtransferase
MITSISTQKALEYFEAKLEFTIDPVRLREEMKSGNLNIVDVREESDYKKGHIPGAINLPKDKWNTYEGLSRNKTNVVYCYSITCQLAPGACKEFAENDYPVMELFGGYNEWRNFDFPIER